MKILIRLFIVFTVVSATMRLSAQDIHFSMFYASPLNLNPALTGVTDCSYRAAGIYRNQWRSISTPYNTYSASFDMKLLQNKLPNDIFGVGAMFVGDKSGDSKLTMSSAMLSAAFHKGLGKSHRHFLGLGIQLGYTVKSLQWQQLAFPAQFDASSQDFNLSQNNGENFVKPKGYFDMQAGLLHQSAFNDVIGMMTGFTVYHLVQPKETFLGDKSVKLPMRFTVHEGLRIRPVKNFYITPNFIFQYQNKAMEANVGTGFEYHIQTAKTLVVPSIGGWYRITGTDAAVINAGVQVFNTKFLFAYDINTSSLKGATGSRGGFELAIIYQGCFKRSNLSTPILVPCPMM
ncbi:MAG TPA: PorP/SprF family type IX secretion system membrane protein [Chitinophagales bacterium]|nr:PorP/SprF family type IX secretion system membrane protein [Chitinophagales bacterium]